ncbi:hypothetical protein DRJ19_05930 [Candidatus Woesearchaeota archaeon]|nr:MAG: hypothetical protein DRJ19_05930 [Candidatus Woesearchaeota archaeon]
MKNQDAKDPVTSAEINNTAPGGISPREQFIEHLKDLQRPISIEELSEILSSTIKYDEANKVITFLCMLLNYTDQDQMNIAFNAESSTGKSYIPLEVASYFPQEDVMIRAYTSPTAFFHDEGEWVKELKIKFIDLEKKILIFLDQPHDMLLQRLRPLLSHDKRELTIKITDRRQKNGLRTKTVVIRGFPTVIFCSSKFAMDEQERTRLLILSPEVAQEKLKASILLLAEKLSDRKRFMEDLENDPKRRWLKSRVALIKSANIEEIIIKPEDMDYIVEKFFADHRHLIPRHQRDFPRLIALIKAHALLNLYSRERTEDGHSIYATREDIEEGYRLYKMVSEANELGLPPEVYDIYVKVLKPHLNDEGITRREFAEYYYEVYHKPLGIRRLNEILKLLSSVGLIREDPDPNDKRYKRIYPQVACHISQEEPTCNQCVFYHTQECIMENPSFIQPTATYPNKCPKFRKKPSISSDRVCEICGSKGAKFHLVPGQGTKWICDRCLREYEGDV